ncbi:MAG: hypothetical protein ACYDGR_01235 [Candidatus Dormibacteria bacterium]
MKKPAKKLSPSPRAGTSYAGRRPEEAIVDPLPGIGSGDAYWDGRHRADPYELGSAYDRQADGTDYYFDVRHQDAHVFRYVIGPVPHWRSIEEALAAARRELPSDATVLSDVQEQGCEQVQFQSTAVGHALSASDPGGFVNFEFQSPNDRAFDPGDISSAAVLAVDSQQASTLC